MSLFNALNADNFELLAGKYYTNPQCTSIEEFQEDLLKFKYLKKLFTRYNNNDDLQIRLILNHIIILYNVFEKDACTAMLYHKMNCASWIALTTFVIFLNYIQSPPHDGICIDTFITNELSKI